MEITPQIRFRGMEPSATIEAAVRKRIARLQRFNTRITRATAYAARLKREFDTMLSKDIMSKKVLSLSPEHSISHAARMTLENRISGLPVCDNSGKLVGILSEGDLLRRAEGSALGRGRVSDRPEPEAFIKGHSWRVGDVMTRDVVTVDEDVPLGRVAAIMAATKSSAFRSCELARWWAS